MKKPTDYSRMKALLYNSDIKFEFIKYKDFRDRGYRAINAIDIDKDIRVRFVFYHGELIKIE